MICRAARAYTYILETGLAKYHCHLDDIHSTLISENLYQLRPINRSINQNILSNVTKLLQVQ